MPVARAHLRRKILDLVAHQGKHNVIDARDVALALGIDVAHVSQELRAMDEDGLVVLDVEDGVGDEPVPKHLRGSTGHRVFIGHGRSRAWKDLKDFLAEDLELEWDEFDRESAAGKFVGDRLIEMLSRATFAFLVVTAEDRAADGSLHARENVIHEIGLFQGRLGFKRAIILFEEGCEEFSNIHGLVQIRFRPGEILSKTEEVRRVLKREGVIQ